MHDACAVAPLLRLLELVRAEEHGFACAYLFQEELMERARSVWIQPVRRLVKNQQQRIVQERAQQCELLLQPFE
jgi:hypothetical protein